MSASAHTVSCSTSPLDWPAFADALQSLITSHGEYLLRVKGVLNILGEVRPVMVHGVQHLFHPPVSLPAWPDADRRSRLVFITRDLGREVVAQALHEFTPVGLVGADLRHDTLRSSKGGYGS